MRMGWQEDKAAVDMAFDSSFNAPSANDLTGFDVEYAKCVERYKQLLRAIGYAEVYDEGAAACEYGISNEHGNSRTLYMELLSERMASECHRWVPSTQEFLRALNPPYQVCITTSFTFRKDFSIPRGYALLVVRSTHLLASFSTEELRQLFGASFTSRRFLKQWLGKVSARMAAIGRRVSIEKSARSVLQVIDARITYRDGSSVILMHVQNFGERVVEGTLHVQFEGDVEERVVDIDALAPRMGLICSARHEMRRVRKARVWVESRNLDG